MEPILGAFSASLKRNNRQIRDDRATMIVSNAELMYRRKIENIEIDIRNMEMELDNMLDLSPTNSQSLVMASDFNAELYINKDVDIAMKIRNMKILLNVAKARYAHLFTGVVTEIPAE